MEIFRMKMDTVLKIWIVTLMGLLILSGGLSAQPSRDKILSAVEIEEDLSCSVIRIAFNFPVRYVKHFPYESGDELRIQLEPIVISPLDREDLTKRESLSPPNDFAKLDEVIYEGDIIGGPYLTLLFRHPVTYKVQQGADFRSLIVAVPGPEADELCLPTQ
jgi:hypothetical protein